MSYESKAEEYRHVHPGTVTIGNDADEEVTVIPSGDGKARLSIDHPAGMELNEMQVHALKQALDRAVNYRRP